VLVAGSIGAGGIGAALSCIRTTAICTIVFDESLGANDMRSAYV
jgi:hypothetical protein